MIRFYILICLLTLAACQRDDIDISEPINVIVEETETFFDSHFIGQTTEVNGLPIQGVQVSIGDAIDYTTDNGVFLFNNTKANSAGALIKMSKNEYYDQYSFIPKAANQFSNLTIELRKKNDHQVFNGSEPNELSINNQISLSIPAGAFASSNGTPYQGQVRIYKNIAPILGNMPFIDKNFKKGILVNHSTLQLIFETIDGLPLQLIKSYEIKSNAQDVTIGILDIQKAKWKEIETEKKENLLIATTDQNLPYIVGQFSPVTRVNTQLVNEDQEGVSFTAFTIKNEEQESYIVYPDQNGFVSFYVPSNSTLSIAVSDVCNNVLTETSISVGNNEIQNTPDIVLKNKDLLTINSTLDACGLPLSDQDLVNVQFQSTGKNIVAYQSQSVQKYVVPSCFQVVKANYFQGKEKKFSVSFSGATSMDFLNVHAMPLCIEKLSGYISINDIPVLFDKDQYYIYRETKDKENLIISDLNGFMISIPKLTGKGIYIPDVIIFNHPQNTECFQEACNNINVWIDEISIPGETVKVRIDGTIKGHKIKGEFVNLLKD